ncbi:MAG: twin-arginine translocase TatA/TatE family subunit [Alphaproteobacteria bacterium]|nr:twin-arginine translocase TatA/TatE family subunit [Alphaproteobacteria bacterium]
MAVKLLVIVALLVLVFGKTKFSDIMADLGSGIRSFRKGLADAEEEEAQARAAKSAPALQAPAQAPVAPSREHDEA